MSGRSEPVSRQEQEQYCLSGHYATCPRLLAAQSIPDTEASALPPEVEAELLDAYPVPAGPSSGGRGNPPRGGSMLPYMVAGCGILVIVALLALVAFLALFALLSGKAEVRGAEMTPTRSTYEVLQSPLVPETPTMTVVKGPSPEHAPLSPTPTSTILPSPTPTPTLRVEPPSPLPTPTPRPRFTPTAGIMPTPTQAPITFVTPTPILTIRSFFAQPVTLNYGECSTLSWDVVGAREILLNGARVGAQGSKRVCPAKTKVFTLEVKNAAGRVERRAVTIIVRPTPTPTPSNTPTPTATPTYTPTPTHFPTFTFTPTPTPTPTPTFTLTPTATPTPFIITTPLPTATPTPTPPKVGYGFILSVEREALQVYPGQWGAVLITIHNAGDWADAYRVSAVASRAGWGIELCTATCYGPGPLQTSTVAPGRQFRLSLRVLAPADARPGDTIDVVVRVVSLGDPLHMATHTLSVRVQSP